MAWWRPQEQPLAPVVGCCEWSCGLQGGEGGLDAESVPEVPPAGDTQSQTVAEQDSMIDLVVETLAILQAFPDETLKQNMQEIFPSLCRMIRCRAATVQMQVALSDLFASKLGHFM